MDRRRIPYGGWYGKAVVGISSNNVISDCVYFSVLFCSGFHNWTVLCLCSNSTFFVTELSRYRC
jgi:hypothetical protein